MIGSNADVFGLLDAVCVARGVQPPNAGQARWITTEWPDKTILLEARIVKVFSISPARKLLRVDHNATTYLCTVGLDIEPSIDGFTEVEVTGGLLTLLIAEGGIEPVASANEILNVIGGTDKRDAGYIGHPFKEIEKLFPAIKVFSSATLNSDEDWRTFFQFSLAQCRVDSTARVSWINTELLAVLETICLLEPTRIPYQTLCRSCMDVDPSALFLALYRCLEGLYSYASSRDLLKELNLTMDWATLATKLEDNLGWRPKEETSLARLFDHAIDTDLQAVFAANDTVYDGIPENLRRNTASRIYQLRNSLVHYRPIHSGQDFSKMKWNDLCAAMGHLVFHIYTSIENVSAQAKVLKDPAEA